MSGDTIVLVALLLSLSTCNAVDAWKTRADVSFLASCSQRWTPHECRVALDGNYELAEKAPGGSEP